MVDAAAADQVLRLIEERDRDGVIDTVSTVAVLGGIDGVVDLINTVQREVGRRWHDQRWTVADEHAATAVMDLALASASLDVPTPSPTRGSVVVTCAEEEWHVLPARMFAEQLRARGFDVTFLGASTPAEHLRAYLSTQPPDAVAISCSIPIYLPGARRSIGASHAAGVPVIAGGAAFGGSARRAKVIGADGWAAEIGDAEAILASWVESPPALAQPADDSAQSALAADRPTVVDDAMRVLAARFPPLATYSGWQQARTREDLDFMLRFVEAAVLTGDDNVVLDFAQWLATLLQHRGLPASVVPLGATSLVACVPTSQEAARRLLELVATTARDVTHDQA